MAQVTAFTAARMKEIEDTTVVSGLVDVHGDLILSTREGTPISAGHVVGPQGNPGTNGTNGTNGKDGVSALDGTPAGTVSLWTGDVAPKNWLICDGSAVSRSLYPSLFDAIGIKYGAGDGVSTFNLPNLKGRSPFGKDTSQTEFNLLGKIGGEKAHLLTAAESALPSHYHIDGWAGVNSAATYGVDTVGSGNVNTQSGQATTNHARTSTSGTTTASQAFAMLPPYHVVNFIIKAVAGETTGDDALVQRISALEANFSSTPAGTMTMWATDVAPTNWLLCDGAAVSRTTYASLFAAIGIKYGAGNGTTTFNLPNLKGRVPVGKDASQTEFATAGQTGGEKAHILTTGELPNAQLRVYRNGSQLVWVPESAVDAAETTNRFHTAVGAPGGQNYLPLTEPMGLGQAHNNIQPYQVVNYIIKITNGDTKADSQLTTRVSALEGGTAFFMAERDKAEAMRNVLTGGGVRKSFAASVSWTERFIMIGAGMDQYAPGGYFEISMPPNGTVIPIRSTSSTTTTVTVANGRIPIPDWCGLYYDLPFGSASQVSQPAKFFLVDYTKDTGFVIPRTAVLVVAKNVDIYSPLYTWGDGRQTDPWKYFTLANGWANYDSGGGVLGNAAYGWAAYKFDTNGKVCMRGLVGNGSNAMICSLPGALAPDNRHIFYQPANNGMCRIDLVYTGSTVELQVVGYMMGGTNAYVDLVGIEWFPRDS
jgi:microcystin-dependent protein